jgi:hypothetical protein
MWFLSVHDWVIHWNLLNWLQPTGPGRGQDEAQYLRRTLESVAAE